ncbi:hypothetical protein [Bacillus cereus group sp. TH152-1LC]|uniref:hypothetical protein n=1 Tax=Bacillus cereus group sp. TH152-1LC TaxID=3018060 RepID=UPI0022E98C46|nr:hypothetical protein [Bacillus cereus group sp. TH152-1LC]MDA1681012.1 hypothetical protein [Bacillus cereus group sp. TH152-1LC]
MQFVHPAANKLAKFANQQTVRRPLAVYATVLAKQKNVSVMTNPIPDWWCKNNAS